MAKYSIGRPVSRFEDRRLRRSRYEDDVKLTGRAYAVFLRSPPARNGFLREIGMCEVLGDPQRVEIGVSSPRARAPGASE